MKNRFKTQVKVVIGAVRDPARFLDWADVVLLVSKDDIGEVTIKEKPLENWNGVIYKCSPSH